MTDIYMLMINNENDEQIFDYIEQSAQNFELLDFLWTW